MKKYKNPEDQNKKFKNCSIPEIYEQKVLVTEKLKDGSNVHNLNAIGALLKGYLDICRTECGDRSDNYCKKRKKMISMIDNRLKKIAVKKLKRKKKFIHTQ